MHGTRAIQKLLDCLTEQRQIELCKNALQGNVVTLVKDINGNHVIQRCLQRLQSPDDIQVMVDNYLRISGTTLRFTARSCAPEKIW
jgi:hypothetical protein